MQKLIKQDISIQYSIKDNEEKEKYKFESNEFGKIHWELKND